MSWGMTLFCDDVRYEVGGKRSLIGIYSGVLEVERFPTILPKFVLSVRYSEAAGESELPVQFNIFVPGRTEALLTANVEKSTIPSRPLVSDQDVEQRMDMIPEFMLSPFPLTEAGYIRVRVKRGDETIKIGALEVRLASNSVAEPTIGLEGIIAP